METFILPPQWTGSEYDGFDIALARLRSEAKNIVYPSLTHENRTFAHGTRVLVLGWGLKGPTEMPNSLQMGDLMILDPKHCPRKMKKYLKAGMLCAYSQHVNVCKGEKHAYP